MLFLLFDIGGDEYALDTTDVVAVVPLVELKRVPRADAALAGILNYHGTPVPVVDLAECATAVRSRAHLNTRIAIVRDVSAGGDVRLIGLLVENATRTLTRAASAFTNLRVAGPPYVGGVTDDGGRVVQQINPSGLLPDDLWARLCRPVSEVS